MQLLKLSKTALLAILISGGLMACGSDENKEPKEVAEDHNDAKFDKVAEFDAQSVVDAYASGLYEIRLADSVKVYGTTSEAKTLAQMLYDAHTKFNGQLKGMADQKQISLPADISTNQADAIGKMRDKKRIDFDKDYASTMVSKHKDAIAMFEKCATDCTDGDIKAWFAGALPELRSHLDMAISAEDKIKAMK